MLARPQQAPCAPRNPAQRLSSPNFPNAATPSSQDIGSGNCYVHNTKLIDHPQKGVLEAPWTVRPKPFWATQNPSLEGMAPAALKFFAYPTVWNMIKVIWKTLV